ncbi:unnamed protein product [Larinioides sclopetarius]|uniref:Uncharacterized protein n=1 Tax=Larinioides sclopetarius TaxID=280406 RepID=A0AAV2BNA3_9ARAC
MSKNFHSKPTEYLRGSHCKESHFGKDVNTLSSTQELSQKETPYHLLPTLAE